MTAPTAAGVRAGLIRGGIQLRHSFAGAGLIGQLFWPVASLVAVVLLRNTGVGSGAGPDLGTFIVPGAVGMFVAFGMLLVVQQLAADREDGTLLRAKAVPDGVTGYFVATLVTASGTVLIYLVVVLVPGLLVVGVGGGVAPSWPTFVWVLVLGLVSSQAIGACLGALVSSARGASYVSLPVIGLIAISGVFYPVVALPGWLQTVAQLFPVYWLGLGMRSAFLSDAALEVEIGHSWRPLETAAVLGAWTLVGLAVAPVVLAAMARKESGSRVARRREQLLQRTT